jgi:hypothetical protein
MKLLSHDEDHVDVRFTTGELILLRHLLDQFCTGAHADISVVEAEALLRRLAAAVERLTVTPPVD